jgi:LacI family transcriptional regulator
MAATREDVERRAKVSAATVSYVINGGPRPVAPETRARVLEAIKELGYQPNAVARNLRMKRTFTIGLVIPDFRNPYFAEVVGAIEEAATEKGYKVILLHSRYDPVKEAQFVDLLRTERVEGVIWIPATSNLDSPKTLSEYAIPTVVYDRISTQTDMLAMVADNYNGGYLATRHLLELGHKRIGYISRPVELSHSQGRLQGYKDALKESGIEVETGLIVKGGFELEEGKQAFYKLCEQAEPPTAVFTFNDIMAIGVLRGAWEKGIRVPEEMSVVGFDDIVQAAYTCPALTTIHLDKGEMGRRGVELLMQLIKGEAPAAELMKAVGVHLVVRESSGPVPR